MNGFKWKAWVVSLATLGLLLTFSSCGDSSKVKIGVILPSEGSLSDYGFQLENGVRLAERQIAARVPGSGDQKKLKSYELFYENESPDPQKLVEAFERLRSKGVTAIIGAASSAATLILAPLANKHKIILLSPASSSPEINQEGTDYVFRNYPSDTLEAQRLANVIFQKCRIQRCLMVRAKNAFSEGITFELLRFARQNRGQIPDEVIKFDSDPENVDFVTIVDRIVQHNPEAVFLGSYSNELIPLIKEIRSREDLEKVYIFTCSAFLPEQVMQATSEAMVEGIMYTGYQWDCLDSDQKIQDFCREFRAANHDTSPTIFAATGYDALWILVTAIDQVNHFLAEEVRGALNNQEFHGILGSTDFNKRGDVTRIPEVFRMDQGRARILTEEDIDVIKRDVLTRVE